MTTTKKSTTTTTTTKRKKSKNNQKNQEQQQQQQELLQLHPPTLSPPDPPMPKGIEACRRCDEVWKPQWERFHQGIPISPLRPFPTSSHPNFGSLVEESYPKLYESRLRIYNKLPRYRQSSINRTIHGSCIFHLLVYHEKSAIHVGSCREKKGTWNGGFQSAPGWRIRS